MLHKTSRANLVVVLSLVAGGCSVSGISTEPETLPYPVDWARGGAEGAVDTDWLKSFDDPQLEALVGEAVAANFDFRAEAARLESARQQVVIARADRLPALDASLDGSRRESEDAAGNRTTIDAWDASLGGRWEADLWGRLSRRQQAAELALAAQEARLQAVERNVAGITAGQYFDAIEARELLAVAQRRLDNALASRDIVASGYRLGLNDALDLYLARSQVERERANLAQQQQQVLEKTADLQLSLARYPDGTLVIDRQLPVLPDPIPAGLPSDLLTRRPDIREAWLGLLAADAELAAAHKARFPSLSLVGSAGVASDEFASLVDDGASAWSIAFGLTQPLFQAGRLAALEQQALARVRIAEQGYLDLVYRAFADVENAISRAASLDERYDALLDAERNAKAALDLALEQYQRGLVSYTIVLESQRQAFDAEATVVQLRNQRLQNRIALYLALGGDFATK